MKKLIQQDKKYLFVTTWLDIFSPMIKNWGTIGQWNCFEKIYLLVKDNKVFNSDVAIKHIINEFDMDDEERNTDEYIFANFGCVINLLNILDKETKSSLNTFKDSLVDFTMQLDELILDSYDIQDKHYPNATNELRILGKKILPYINQKLLEDWKNDNIQNVNYEESSIITKMYMDTLDNILEVLSNEKNDEIKNIILDINKKMVPIIDFGKLFFCIYP